MLTREQAEASIGLKVVYRAPDITSDGYGPAGYSVRTEEGVITSVNDRGAFVRYGSDTGSKHTLFEQLTLVSKVPRPDSVTHHLCPEAPTGMTHHLVPSGPDRKSVV